MESRKKTFIAETRDKDNKSPSKIPRSKSKSPTRPSPTKPGQDRSKLLHRAEEKPSSDDFLRCDLCRHTVDDPRTLRCLHSYCKDCLMTYIFETTKEDSKKIVCPVCVQSTDPPAKGRSAEDVANLLPTNQFLKGYLEAKSLKEQNKKCDTCRRQNKSNGATKWCKICHDALCTTCVGFHNALKTTKKHKLEDIDKLRGQPIDQIMSSPLCGVHSGEPVTRFCEKHKDVVCEKCVASNHKGCNVIQVKDAIEKHKGEIEEVTNALSEEARYAKSIYEERTKSDKEFDNSQAEVLSTIQSVRQKINENLQKCEKDMLDEFAKVYGQEKTNMENDKREAQRIRKSVSKVKGLTENAVIHGTESHVLQVLPDAAREGEIYRTKLASLSNNIKHTRVEFRLDPSLQRLMDGVKKIGDLRVSKTKPELVHMSSTSLRSFRSDSDPEDESDIRGTGRRVGFVDTVKPRARPIIEDIKPLEEATETKKIKAAQTGSFYARSPSDGQSCWFTGIGFLHNGCTVLVDRNNSKIKVFNKNNTMSTETALKHQPFGLAVMGPSEIAVTIPRENKIELFNVSDSKIAHKKTIVTSESGYGICYSTGKGFLVACACTSPPCIKHITVSGDEKEEICPNDRYHMAMFFRPWYVKMDASGEKMYVSDCHKSHVTCISSANMQMYQFTRAGIHAPRGLHVTKSGKVLVCGFGSDNVQLIGHQGEFVSDVLCRKDEIHGPQDVALNEADGVMALTFDPSSGRSDTVKLYKITL